MPLSDDAKTLLKSSTLSRVHQRYRQTADKRIFDDTGQTFA